MGLIQRLLMAWRDRPDPAAVMQTPVQKYSGFDQEKGRVARLASLERARWRREVESRRATRGDVRDIREGRR